MPLYRFKALSSRGRKISGEITAANERDLSQQLNKMGLQMLTAKLVFKNKIAADDSRFSLHPVTIVAGLAGIIAMIGEFLASLVKRLLPKRQHTGYDPQKFARTKKSRNDIRHRIAKGSTRLMSTFDYCAKTPQGGRIYGEMDALDTDDLSNRLLLLELTLVTAAMAGAKAPLVASILPLHLPLREETILARQLEI